MPFAKAESSLGGIVDKLRRSLSLSGLIQADFKPDIIPIVTVDDATRPGTSTGRGRRFAINLTGARVPTAFGAAGSLGFKVSSDVIVEGIRWSASVAGLGMSLQLLYDAATADPFAINTFDGGWLEQCLVSTDVPPIARSGVAADTALGIVVASDNTQVNTAISFALPPSGIHLPAGTRGFVRVSAAASVTAYLFGKTF